MGKAATLNGVIGDVMIPGVVHDEHSQTTYLFENAFTAEGLADDLTYGTVLDNQKGVSVRGTFLQTPRYMDVFYREGYTDIEMEAGPYLSAVYEISRPKRYPDNEIVDLHGLPFEVGILHYASDTPLSKGRNLGSRFALLLRHGSDLRHRRGHPAKDLQDRARPARRCCRKGRQPSPDPSGGDVTTVGKSLRRIDALGKVTGETVYPGDLYPPGMLAMKILFAGRPHAVVRRLDTAAAERLPGVVAIFTARDVPVNEYGLIFPDQPVLCGPGSAKPYADRVRFVGDQLAVVVAEDEATAARALKEIDVEFEDLPVVTDVDRRLAAGAPLLFPDRDSNLFCHYRIRKGDAEAGFRAAAVVIVDGSTTRRFRNMPTSSRRPAWRTSMTKAG